jgi:hypothetical protein
MSNHLSGFETKSLTNRQPWFLGSTKKHVLLVSTCTMQTAYGVTRPLNHPATEYLTCAAILGPLHQVSYSCHDPHRCMSRRTTTCTPRDKQTRFSKRNKDKRKTNEHVLNLNSNLANPMTHHNQTKELTTWFLKYV